jgi:NAD(P)H-nitrite reductase large subunit
VLDEAESGIIEERLAKEGVVMHPHTELAEIIGQRGRVGGVRTTGGQELKCSLVGYAIGVWPRVKLARGARLAVKRGILVDAYLQTSATDVYAAGDAAEVFDPASGQTVLDSLWWIACAVGRASGQNMADCETPYVRTAPINVTRLAGLTTTIIGAVGRGGEAEQLGIARGDSEAWRQVPDALGAESGSPVNHLRLAVGRQALLGAVLMGDQSLSRPLQHLISEQADISAIRADLLGGSRPLGETILSYWADWKVKHAS